MIDPADFARATRFFQSRQIDELAEALTEDEPPRARPLSPPPRHGLGLRVIEGGRA